MRKVNGLTPCVFDKNTMWLQDFFDTWHGAERYCKKKNKKDKERPFVTATYAVFLSIERDSLLKPATIITKSFWWESLEVLPPMNWKNNGVIETFMSSEYWTGSYTRQYGKMDENYITKMVDVSDKTTWIKIEDFENDKS